ncbi:hypothetical protein BV20DRAFT_575893 [Pilatotrama ljubarskyi]|nr:hypothetical protein BV20DRAFT_575893 [Pilatotrama ljubarskyi]
MARTASVARLSATNPIEWAGPALTNPGFQEHEPDHLPAAGGDKAIAAAIIHAPPARSLSARNPIRAELCYLQRRTTQGIPRARGRHGVLSRTAAVSPLVNPSISSRPRGSLIVQKRFHAFRSPPSAICYVHCTAEVDCQSASSPHHASRPPSPSAARGLERRNLTFLAARRWLAVCCGAWEHQDRQPRRMFSRSVDLTPVYGCAHVNACSWASEERQARASNSMRYVLARTTSGRTARPCGVAVPPVAAAVAPQCPP